MDYPITPRYISDGTAPPIGRHFWMATEGSYDLRYISPFQEQRHKAHMTPEDVARAMKMSVVDYVDMENGHTISSAEDILNFCEAVACHPLDLYRLTPNAHAPLPREIFESLMVIATSSAYSPAERQRNAKTLDREYRYAEFSLTRNADEVIFLRRALGYNPATPDIPIPYYLPPTMRQEDIDKALDAVPEKPLFVHVMQNLPAEMTPRLYLEMCLNAYQIDLERRVELRGRIAREHLERRNRVNRVLEKLAIVLYGADKKDFVIDGMKTLIEMNSGEQLRLEFREKFLKKPDMLCPLVEGADQVKLRYFLNALEESCRIDRLYADSDPDVFLFKAEDQLLRLTEWRASARGTMIMDWFEHWVILGFLERESIEVVLKTCPDLKKKPGGVLGL